MKLSRFEERNRRELCHHLETKIVHRQGGKERKEESHLSYPADSFLPRQQSPFLFLFPSSFPPVHPRHARERRKNCHETRPDFVIGASLPSPPFSPLLLPLLFPCSVPSRRGEKKNGWEVASCRASYVYARARIGRGPLRVGSRLADGDRLKARATLASATSHVPVTYSRSRSRCSSSPPPTSASCVTGPPPLRRRSHPLLSYLPLLLACPLSFNFLIYLARGKGVSRVWRARRVEAREEQNYWNYGIMCEGRRSSFSSFSKGKLFS